VVIHLVVKCRAFCATYSSLSCSQVPASVRYCLNMLVTCGAELLVQHEPQARAAILNLGPGVPWMVFRGSVNVDGKKLQLYFY
jgi:hypothetical protein